MYTVKCDNCGKSFEDEHQGFCAWNDKSSALENATEADWIQLDLHIHYCPECYSFDDNDKLILKIINKENN